MRTTLLVLLITGIIEAGCNKDTPAGAVIMVSGTLYDYTGLDGCGWVIKLADGTLLEPTNLADFPVTPEDGKPIFLTYTEQDMGSICMIGPVVQIQSMRE